MKYILLTVTCFMVMASSAQTKKVLFLGNSYTNVNNLPLTLQNLAASFGDVLSYDQNTPGGYTMQGHSTNATSLAKIAVGGWDFVAIQSQSQEPSFSPAQVANDVYPYAKIICDSIESANICTEPLFFMTWGRKNGDASNCPFYPPICTYDGMQQRLRESYEEMAQDNDATVSPVGAVWKQVRDSLPGLELYSPDESHPSVAGTYVAACTFYASIWRKSPVGSSFISGLSASDAAAIQLLAERVVLDSLSNWRIGHADVVANFSTNNTGGATYEFTDLSANGDSLFWDFGDGSTLNSTGTINYTYTSSGTFNIELIVTNGCMSDTITQQLTVTTVGLNDSKNEIDFDIYPNPVQNGLTVKSVLAITQFMLYDQVGKLVIERKIGKLHRFEIDFSSLPDGAYQLVLYSGDKRTTTKVIK
ncbi:MAG: T9SS type A sorting domain-containing protein [Flavobacteriales bacterium]|nr:T9SS type A sorting domain-containing protein [Flavobacteriales bacterium]